MGRVLSLLLAGAAMAAAGGAGAVEVPWRGYGDGIDARARWTAPDGLRVELRCDAAESRIVLRLSGDHLPSRLSQVMLIADGIAMAYPADRTGGDARPAFLTRIALDAPILDRMLVARAFTLRAGERAVATGVPGDALARVVRACRAHYWPREAAAPARPASPWRPDGSSLRLAGSSLRPARSSLRPARMASSDAGLAKK